MIDIEKIKEIVCDRLCMWPGQYKDSDDLWNERCDRCPLLEVLDEETVEPNIFDQEEKYYPCTVQVLRNSVTGEVSVGWWMGEHNACEVKP